MEKPTISVDLSPIKLNMVIFKLATLDFWGVYFGIWKPAIFFWVNFLRFIQPLWVGTQSATHMKSGLLRHFLGHLNVWDGFFEEIYIYM